MLDREQCEKLGMGAFMAVAQGATEPPKFIVMEYEGFRAKSTVCLVGKGLTFDTGGISLKPGADMEEMKFDMCGGAAVLGAMKFVAERKCLGDFLDLAIRLLRAEVNRGANTHGSHFECLFHAAEHPLVVRVGTAQ